MSPGSKCPNHQTISHSSLVTGLCVYHVIFTKYFKGSHFCFDEEQKHTMKFFKNRDMEWGFQLPLLSFSNECEFFGISTVYNKLDEMSLPQPVCNVPAPHARLSFGGQIHHGL